MRQNIVNTFNELSFKFHKICLFDNYYVRLGLILFFNSF